MGMQISEVNTASNVKQRALVFIQFEKLLYVSDLIFMFAKFVITYSHIYILMSVHLNN